MIRTEVGRVEIWSHKDGKIDIHCGSNEMIEGMTLTSLDDLERAIAEHKRKLEERDK